MQFDALATACMANELQQLVCPGRIQAVVLVDEHSVGLEVYTQGMRRQLLLCAGPQAARLHLVEHKLRRGFEGETPLLLLLRKYLRDALLTAVLQPIPYERMVHLACEHKEHGGATLVIELIGRQANLILLRPDGRILECLHRHATPGGSSGGAGKRREPGAPRGATEPQAGERPAGRVLLPGRLYVPPPLQEKLPPVDDGRSDYYERLAAVLNTPRTLAKALVEGLAGMSPQAAREVAWRTAGDPEAPATATHVLALAAVLQELWAPAGASGAWEPGVLRVGEQVIGFAPYAAHGPGVFAPAPTFSEAVAAFYAAGAADWKKDREAAAGGSMGADSYAQQRANVAASLRRARQGVERRLAGLAADAPQPGEAQRLRTEAEWLLALSSQVVPGQEVLEVPLAAPQEKERVAEDDDGGDTGEERRTLRITLDPTLTPVEQAQRLFRRAAKLERAEVFIPQRRAELLADLALIEELGLDLERATNQPEIAAVARELAAVGLSMGAGSQQPGSRQPGSRQPGSGQPGSQQPGSRQPGSRQPGGGQAGGLLRVRSGQGLEIVVGRNARQNERVTFDEAHPEDLWLHARGVPGSHVIVRGAGTTPDDETVRMAAQLAAYHSGARGERAVDVIVTRKRFVQRAPGGKVGQVLVKQEELVVTVPGELPSPG